ncbi:MAG: deoxyribodipyrimidine photolyase [Pirellulales bacterium]
MTDRLTVPENRIRAANAHPIRHDGEWVVYWMTALRRTRSNFALQHARDWARKLKKPLVILEGLRIHYRWASERMHRFVIEGMRDNAAACRETPAVYYPYVEPKAGQGSGLIAALAKRACLVVTDDYPCFFHPHMIEAIKDRMAARLELVDGNCLMPLSAGDRTFTVAHSYRRFMQKTLPKFLDESPELQPLGKQATRDIPHLKELPQAITRRWRPADLQDLLRSGGLDDLAIDHSVKPIQIEGGQEAAGKLMRSFIRRYLNQYDEDRNHPDKQATSRLSGHMHFGHVSPHELFWELMHALEWNPSKLSKPNGKVEGFWNVGRSAEAFLDQLLTWREIGFNMCYREPNYDRYESLPEWAQVTLAEHARDKRPRLYTAEQLDRAQTYDPIWNAAQRQLVRDGCIHNYLRMLWGKKILEWSPSPQVALDIMIDLNNKYAIDGRDPNSYSGIFWVLGRYDRAWGPERQIYGKIRYMTSDSTARKVRLKEYLQEYATF